MLRLTYQTADDVLENIKTGDHISDEYQIKGIVKEIERHAVGMVLFIHFIWIMLIRFFYFDKMRIVI